MTDTKGASENPYLADHAWAVQADAAVPLWRQCAQHIQDLIHKGNLTPGDPLPRHTELAPKMGVGTSTLQKTLSWLTDEGFLVRYRQRGTFVADQAGNQRETWIAVMTRAMFDPALSQWDMQAARATVDILADAEVPCRFYHNHYLPSGPEPECQELDPRLCEDVNAGHVRGVLVIGAVPANHREFRTLLKAKSIPMVETAARGRETPFVVEFDRCAFVRTAVSLAARRGCTRLAMIETPGDEPDGRDPLVDVFKEAVENKQLAAVNQPIRRIAWPPDTAKGVVAFKALWEESDAKPDGVLVTDEYVAQGVAQAVFAAGLRIPDDLWIVTYFTRGAKIVYPIPVDTIEYDTYKLIDDAWHMLRARMNGEIARQRHRKLSPHSINKADSWVHDIGKPGMKDKQEVK
ncbi:MAG: substrate-binding domain-containing protein [Candidatus Pacebacteria bacterium]|nr:substrate-binding domain-containing protein [Candidatus Paceibacterota bacterium]